MRRFVRNLCKVDSGGWKGGTMEFEFLGLTMDQLLMLAGLGVVLLVALVVLRTVVKLTRAMLKLGCVGILILLAVVFFVLRAAG